MSLIGLFPLELVLVPTERVTLNIFEPRYKELIGECIESGEEFGIVLCLVLVALFAFVVLRGLRHSMTRGNDFCRLGAAGLAILFGLQSAINMAVNMHLIPAKGMTLPFISYGGSSMISVAYATGMLIALTRSHRI